MQKLYLLIEIIISACIMGYSGTKNSIIGVLFGFLLIFISASIYVNTAEE